MEKASCNIQYKYESYHIQYLIGKGLATNTVSVQLFSKVTGILAYAHLHAMR